MRLWVSLACYAGGTIVGYVVYEMALFDLPAHALVINTFFWLFVTQMFERVPNSIMPRPRSPVPRWKPSISGYIVVYAAAQFFYWYAFWHAMFALEHLSGGSDTKQGANVALAVLALTTVLNPLISGRYIEPQRRLAAPLSLGLCLLLLFAIFLTKLDGTKISSLSDLTHEVASTFGLLSRTDLRQPICLLLLAVFAEIASDCVYHQLSRDICRDHGVFTDRDYADDHVLYPSIAGSCQDISDTTATRENVNNSAGDDMQRWVVTICLMLSLALSFFHADFQVLLSAFSEQWAVWAMALPILGLVGSSARTLFVTPLMKRGYAQEVVVPVLAARLVLFPMVGYIAMDALEYVAPAIGSSNGPCDWKSAAACHFFRTHASPGAGGAGEIADATPAAPVATLHRIEVKPLANWTYWVGLLFSFFCAVIIWVTLARRGLTWSEPGLSEELSRLVAGQGAAIRTCAESSKMQVLRFFSAAPGVRRGHMSLDRSGAFQMSWKSPAGTAVSLTFSGGEHIVWTLERDAQGLSRSSGEVAIEMVISILKAHGAERVLLQRQP